MQFCIAKVTDIETDAFPIAASHDVFLQCSDIFMGAIFQSWVFYACPRCLAGFYLSTLALNPLPALLHITHGPGYDFAAPRRGMCDLQAHERFTYEAAGELLLLPIRPAH